MKTLTSLLIFILLLNSHSIRMNYGSNSIGMNADLDSSLFLGASFFGDYSAWLVTRYGRELITSFDGGGRWNTISADAVNGFGQVSFISQLEGWATGSKGWVWKTINGGGKWNAISKLEPHNAEGFIAAQAMFTDELHGWVLESPHYLWSTKDGGRNWKAYSPLVNGEYTDLIKFTFVDSKTGWLACDKRVILKTTDGGNVWKVLRIPGPSPNLSVYDIFFLNDKTGWALVGDSIYHSVNGGETWQLQSPSGSRPVILSLFFLDKNVGWAAGYTNIYAENIKSADEVKGELLRSIDGGKTWENVTVHPNEERFLRIHFSDHFHGWLISEDKVYRSSNAGKSWDVVYKFPEQ